MVWEALQGVPRKAANPNELLGLYNGCYLLGIGREARCPRTQQGADRPGKPGRMLGSLQGQRINWTALHEYSRSKSFS